MKEELPTRHQVHDTALLTLPEGSVEFVCLSIHLDPHERVASAVLWSSLRQHHRSPAISGPADCPLFSRDCKGWPHKPRSRDGTGLFEYTIIIFYRGSSILAGLDPYLRLAAPRLVAHQLLSASPCGRRPSPCHHARAFSLCEHLLSCGMFAFGGQGANENAGHPRHSLPAQGSPARTARGLRERH